LVLVHLIMIAHGIQWLIVGRTLSPVEPSESMETLATGAVNAGFVFFAVAILLTLIFGRFVCGWACHFIAYQDLCHWLLGKVGIQPKPLRARLLMWAPLGMALYMFVWPPAYRIWKVWRGDDPHLTTYLPPLSSGFVTEHFWETFPGWVFAILTVGIAGFAIVYFLGAKGFCTYACPYGGFFSIADRFAPVRVRVSDACDHTGVCTTVCTSNVDVAGEVARYGMVISPGCMKCGDCIRSCPNEALSWARGRPAIFAPKPKTAQPRVAARSANPPTERTLALWEEISLVALFLFYLLAWRGLYGGFPFLMSAGISAIMAYVTLLALRVMCRPDVALQSVKLRSASRTTRAGIVYSACVAALVVFTAHSAFVQFHRFMGNRSFERIAVSESARAPEFDPVRDLDEASRFARDAAGQHYQAVIDWGLLDFLDVRARMAWVELLRGHAPVAEAHARAIQRRRPEWATAAHLLGVTLRAQGRFGEAIDAFRESLARDADLEEAAHDLGNTLMRAGRFAEAAEHYRDHLARCPDDARAHYHLGALAVDRGDIATAVPHLERAISLRPELADAHYQLGLALLYREQVADAIPRLQETIRLRPGMAAAHYNLAVACFMGGDLGAARVHAADAIRLDTGDAQARSFLAMLNSQPDGGP
jgi:tetratricopeptide (TPR) repeat protein/ferredoxin